MQSHNWRPTKQQTTSTIPLKTLHDKMGSSKPLTYILKALSGFSYCTTIIYPKEK